MVHYGGMPALSWCVVPGRGYTGDRTTAGKKPRGPAAPRRQQLQINQFVSYFSTAGVGYRWPVRPWSCPADGSNRLHPARRLLCGLRDCQNQTGKLSQCDVVGIRHWNPGEWTDSTVSGVCVNLQNKRLAMRVVARRGCYKLVQGAGAVLVNKVYVTGPVEFDALG